MIRYLFLGLLITSVIIGSRLAFNAQQNSLVAQQNRPLNNSEVNQARSGTVAQPNTQQVTANSLPDINTNDVEEAKLTAAHKPQSNLIPWSLPNEAPLVPAKYQQKGLDPRAIKLSLDTLKNATAGTQLTLPIPQLAQSFPMEIEQIKRHKNGDKTLKGHLSNTKNPYSVVITEGQNLTFATINTPDGAYVMEAEGDLGWIMSIANLDQLIDVSQDDTKIPNFNQ